MYNRRLRRAEEKKKRSNGKDTEFRQKSGSAVSPPAGPTSAEIEYLVALYNQCRYTEAESIARKMTESFPNFGFGWKALGVVHQSLGHNLESLENLQRAVPFLRGDAELHNSLGITFSYLGRREESESCFRRALEINPDYADAYNNLGNALKDLGQLKKAEACYRRALEIRPDDAEAHSNLGNILKNLGRLEEAEACYRHALVLMPNFAESYNNLGNILKDLGRQKESVANYQRALEIKPDYSEAHSNLLFSMLYSSRHHPSHQLAEARRYGEMITSKASFHFSSWPYPPKPERLRVGLVSGDLRSHPVGYFLEGILKQLDSSRIELIAYSTDCISDDLTSRIKPYFSSWQSLVGLSDETAARLIHSDGVHLLLDLSGHTAKNRLPVFAFKPAPVQATWLGYSGTTGVVQIDYIIGDPHVTPAYEDVHFTECVWPMPESYLCFTPPEMPAEIGPLPALAKGHITFGCFNNLSKINDKVVALWARVLRAVPDSNIILKAKQFNDPKICETTRQYFADLGVGLDRLLLKGPTVTRSASLAEYNRVDVALDPFPYTGTTTSVEGLWMGVPVITRRGDRFLSHIGESIVLNSGLTDWIAENDDDYVAKAMFLTRDINWLASLRAGLRKQVLSSPLFDAPRFARNLEDALWGMWLKCCEKVES